MLATNIQTDIAIFLSTSGHSGVDRVMKNLIPEIASRGFKIDLLSIDNHGPYLEQNIDGVRVIKLGVSHTNSSLLPLARYLKQQRPVVLLSDKDKVNRIAILAKILAGVETRVCVRYGSTVSIDTKSRGKLARKVHYWSMHYLYRKAYAILTPSRGAADDLAQFANIPAQRVIAVPSPVVSSRMLELSKEIPSHPWMSSDIPIVLGIGELGHRKDFSTLIRAFAEVKKKRPVRLIILGRGKQQQQLLDLAKELNVSSVVDLLGFTDNPYSYLLQASVFVITSRYEGSPVVLMEAQGIGTPSVATDAPSGSREILDNGKYGKLCPIGDYEAVAQAILDTLDNPPERGFLRHAAQRYTTAASADAYLRAMGFEVSVNGQ